MNDTKHKSGYILVGGLPFAARFLIIILLVAGGLLWQVYANSLIPGVFLVLVAAIFALRRGLSVKVSITGGETEWESVTLEKWNQFNELRQQTRKWQSSWSNLTSVKGILMFILFVLALVAAAVLTALVDVGFMIILVVNALILAVPVFLKGNIHGFTQNDLNKKLHTLVELHAELEKEFPDLELVPMLGLSTGEQDGQTGRVPTDAKMMIKFPEQPEDFYGIQITCSLNMVAGSAYPYVYAVVLAAPGFDTGGAERTYSPGSKLVFEPSRTQEAIVLVIRQRTTKTSGYHTKLKDQFRVIDSAVKLARQLLGT